MPQDGSPPPSLADWRRRALDAETGLNGAVLGQARAVRLIMIAVFCRGHVLLEGDVGVGKTTLLRAVARAVGGPFTRVEGTIDLMPGDFLYDASIGEDGRPRVDPGPALAHGEDLSIFFFNEINRARPQVHALLLRMMAERSVTAFRAEHRFPHLQVFADRNQIERDETFELPAAARDRFLMEIAIAAPEDPADRMALAFETRFHDVDRLIATVGEGLLPYRGLNAAAEAIQAQVGASDALRAYVFGLWEALRDPIAAGLEIAGVDMARLVRGGASPRGAAALVRAARVAAWLEGRDAALPQDVRAVFAAVMAHRTFLAPVYEGRRAALMPALIDAAFARTPAPA
ncbi:AAA family ATPase [Rubrimonas cliftonensis]|uniref:MoxR-like ATPase n=1 Tax=Rubrimonas cliftonensis TaxID=89524 RepID=A0A1H4FH22_9RHOB|nr:MoxR family ATPase [Rubrimonas cliftonensis]SEA96575.1 MoxR-like ATPase [Rubrimonas cliftonensis]